MSADGPVASAQKKTAVKPSAPASKPPAAQKALGSAPSAKKALPASNGAPKALPAPSPKPATSKPAARAPPGKPNTAQKPSQNSKPGGPTSVRSQGPVGVSKPSSNSAKPSSNVNTSGKVMVSAESRPGYRKSAVTRNTHKSEPAKGGDILGLGENFGDISKSRPKDSQSKNSSGAARKPSAADPLALGELEKIGQKKK